MNQKKIKEDYQDFANALGRLREALAKDVKKDSVFVDGTIQRFEFTFEQAWKLAKTVLKHQGIEATSPRSAIKEAYQAEMIEDGEGWIDMLEDRNKTSHIYDEQEALTIYTKIKESHVKLLDDFETYIAGYLRTQK